MTSTAAIATGTPPNVVPASRDVARVVELAARADALEVTASAIQQNADRIDAESPKGRHPFVLLAATCVEHGLLAASLHAPARELFDRLDEGSTLVIERVVPFPAWLVISAPSGTTAITVYEVVNGEARELRQSLSSVLRGLGGEAVDALLIEPAFPLDGLRNQGGGGPLGPVAKLWTLVSLERGELMRIAVYAVFIGLLTLVVPVSVQALVNSIAFGAVLQPLIILGIALFVGLTLSATLQGLRAHVVEILQRRIFVRVVNDLGRRLPQWSGDAHAQYDTRELANRFFDVVTLQKSFATLTVDGLGLLLQTTMGLLLLAFYHPVLLAFDVVLVVGLALLIWLPIRGGVKSAVAESKAKYATAAWLEAIVSQPLLFGSTPGARMASDRTSALARHYLGMREIHWRHLLVQVIGGLTLHVVAAVALLVVGGWLVMQRELTLGQLVASELVVAAIGAGFVKLGKQMEKLYDAAAGIDKIGKLVNVPRERSGGLRVNADGPARVKFQNVTDPRLAEVLDLKIPAGSAVAITGDSATGKTTMLNMLVGRTSPEGGTVRVNGVDLQRAHLADFRSLVGWLDDTAQMPEMTVLEFLRLDQQGATVDEILEVIDQVGLKTAIERFPDGLNQRLLPHGGPLSRTQVLRLGIARILLQAPQMVLVDGALDAFAADTALLERVIRGPWTTIVVSGIAQVATLVDRVITLEATTPDFDDQDES